MRKARIWTLILTMIFATVFFSPSVFATENSVPFEYTGNTQTWQVPQNVNQVKIEAWGAQGGSDSGRSGGLGGYAYGIIDVTPGNTLNIFVGGQGSDCTAGNGGGFNGGGNAGPSGCSGGGGGASDVRIGGTDLNNRIIVAGGGGGAGLSEGLYGGGGPGGGSGPFIGYGQGGNHPSDGGGGGGGYQGGFYGLDYIYYTFYNYIWAYDVGGFGGSSYTGGVIGGGMTAGVQYGNGRMKITYTQDTTAPTATVSYSKTDPTNQDVVATITPSEPIVGLTSYTFTENGSYTFQFTDLAGNAGSVTAIVSNIDKVAPSAIVNYSKTDPTNQDVVATITPSESIVGLTSYTFTENGSYTFQFTDLAGNTGSVTAIVSNIDKVAPALTVQADKASLTPPNHKLVNIGLSWNAHDADSGIASVKLVSVTSNEPDDGLGDGDTSNDIQAAEFGTADQTIQLRAERSGKGTGRVYTITYVATDLAGNSVTASTTVTVPHSAKK